LTAWWIRLGIRPMPGRPLPPHTQGKEERFHRTLQDELLRWTCLESLAQCRARFDAWRDLHNHERPHEALGMDVPSQRYRISPRPYPEQLPPVEDASGVVRKVRDHGRVTWNGRPWMGGKAFAGEPLVIRETNPDGLYDVYSCALVVHRINLAQPDSDWLPMSSHNCHP
jgi:hypothetical protein